MKKRLVAMVITGIMALTLTACGGTKNTSGAKNTQTSTSKYLNNNAVSSELDASKTRVWTMGDDLKNKPFNKVEMKFADKILFLDSYYISEQGNGCLTAKGISIKSVSVNITPMGSIPQSLNYLVDKNGVKVLKKMKYDNDSSYDVIYYVQEAAGCYCMELSAQAVFNAADRDKQVFRSFVDSFAPAFETTFLSNFQ